VFSQLHIYEVIFFSFEVIKWVRWKFTVAFLKIPSVQMQQAFRNVAVYGINMKIMRIWMWLKCWLWHD